MNLSFPQLQLTDYLTQIKSLSGQHPLPRLTYKLIADALKVSESTINNLFANRKVSKPVKNFIKIYPEEYKRWPKERPTIMRVVSISDAIYFLDIFKKNAIPTSLKAAEMVPQPERVQTMLINPVIYAPIVISYRGHQSLKDGQGMLFDHMRFEDLTKFPTRTLIPKNEGIERHATKFFKQALINHPASLLYGGKDENLITYPPNVKECKELGLIIIPGRVKAIEDEPIRLAHEYKIIRDALNRGQPILGICAGSWRLYEQLYIWTKFPDSLNAASNDLSRWHISNKTTIDVQDHCYNGGMLRLDGNGVQANYNVQIHDISIKTNSLLIDIFGTKWVKINGRHWKAVNEDPLTMHATQRFKVNSVHWKAVNESRLPENVQICAEAMESSEININTRNKTKMNPEEDTAEAFENVKGAPLFGIQWHPEGYGINTPHAKLIQYMTFAGNAYAAKRQMLRELKEQVYQIDI